MIHNLVTAFLVALAAVTASEVTTAHGAEPATMTLACKGTETASGILEDAKSEPVSMGIIVNFTAGTVTGLTMPGANLPVKNQQF